MNNMKNDTAISDWTAYIHQMETVLALELDDARLQEILVQFGRIAQMAQPLMALSLDPRLEIAGVYRA